MPFVEAMVPLEEYERPVGALRFADPAKAGFPRQIQTFNEPHSPNSHGEQHGVRSVTGNLVDWYNREGSGVDLWAEMNRKRGTPEAEKD